MNKRPSMFPKFWPFPLLRAYDNSKALTKLFTKVLNSKDLVLQSRPDYDRCTISSSEGTIEFYRAENSSLYTLAASGVFTSTKQVVTKWNRTMPSRYMCRKLKRLFDLETSQEQKLMEALNESKITPRGQ